MRIRLVEESPITQRPRRLAPLELQIVNDQIHEWMNAGIIRESRSPFASPVVVVPKKNGKHRICVDYRMLNKKVIRDHFPLPLIEDQLDKLTEARIYSTLDLKESYFHVNIDEDDRKYTSFVTPTGQYEFNRAPFGLCTSGTAFCRLIHDIFHDLINEGVVVIFVDDIIIPSRDVEEGVAFLTRVIEAAERGGLVINWDKCKFLQQRIDYLGYVVQAGTVTFSDDRAHKIRNYPAPRSREEARRFYHLASYFRRFIPKFAEKARPLSELLKKESQYDFGDEAKAAFETLKAALSEPPVLAIYDPNAETEVHTDASAVAVSGILMQKGGDDKFHPVHYYSRLTLGRERNYPSFDLECLAVVESVRKFRVYLLGRKFKLVTDCTALRSALQKKEILPRVSRWAMELEEYEYETEHRKAGQMQHADALSRALLVNSTTARLKALQSNDEKITSLKGDLQRGAAAGFWVEDDILYKEHEGRRLLVVPEEAAQALIQEIHQRGHFGVRKMKSEFLRQYFIDGFDGRAQRCLQNCIQCLMVERKAGKEEGLLRPIPKGDVPMDVWHLDHLGPLPSTSKQYEYILSIVDAFSKFVWLFPCKRATAEETLRKVEVLGDVFGYPRKIVTDRGVAFTSSAFKDFCAQNNVELHHIATGVPRGNGQVERVHRVVISSLAKLSSEEPDRWYKHTNRVQRYLNGSHQRAIDATPFKVMFGIEMRLGGEDREVGEVVDAEKREMFNEERDSVRVAARKSIERIQRENKRYYDRNRKGAVDHKVGDVVFIRKTQFGVGQKLRAKFLGPYKVRARLANDRYEVEKADPSVEGPLRTTTAADLMKRGFVGFEQDESSSQSGDGRVGVRARGRSEEGDESANDDGERHSETCG